MSQNPSAIRNNKQHIACQIQNVVLYVATGFQPVGPHRANQARYHKKTDLAGQSVMDATSAR
jgi:hypothetical protein